MIMFEIKIKKMIYEINTTKKPIADNALTKNEEFLNI